MASQAFPGRPFSVLLLILHVALLPLCSRGSFDPIYVVVQEFVYYEVAALKIDGKGHVSWKARKRCLVLRQRGHWRHPRVSKRTCCRVGMEPLLQIRGMEIIVPPKTPRSDANQGKLPACTSRNAQTRVSSKTYIPLGNPVEATGKRGATHRSV